MRVVAAAGSFAGSSKARAHSAIIAVLLVVLTGCYNALDWREFRWEPGGFSATLPAKPERAMRALRIGTVDLELTMFSVRASGAAFGVGYAELPGSMSPGERAVLLAAARDALTRSVGAAATSQPITLDGHPGLAFEQKTVVEGKSLLLAGRLYATDRRFYQVVYAGPPEHTGVADLPLFLGSLRLLK